MRNILLLSLILTILSPVFVFSLVQGVEDAPLPVEESPSLSDFGVSGIDASQATVSGSQVTITGGEATLQSVEGVTIVIDGASADASSFTGDLSMGPSGGTVKAKNGVFRVGAGQQVSCKDGLIIANGVDVEEGILPDGSVISGKQVFTTEDGFIHSYEELMVNGWKFTPKSGAILTYKDNGLLSDEFVSLASPSGYFGKMKGYATFVDEGEIIVYPPENKRGWFLTDKGAYVSFDQPLTVCKAGRCEYGGNQLLMSSDLTVQGRNGDVRITVPDGAYEHVYIPGITGDANVDLHITKGQGEVMVRFTRNLPTLRGNLEGLTTSVATVISSEGKLYPWMITATNENGRVVGAVKSQLEGTFAEYMATLPASDALTAASVMLIEQQQNTNGISPSDMLSMVPPESKASLQQAMVAHPEYFYQNPHMLSMLDPPFQQQIISSMPNEGGLQDLARLLTSDEEGRAAILRENPSFKSEVAYLGIILSPDLSNEIVERTKEFTSENAALLYQGNPGRKDMQEAILSKVSTLKADDAIAMLSAEHKNYDSDELKASIIGRLDPNAKISGDDLAKGLEATKGRTDLQEILLRQANSDVSGAALTRMLDSTSNDAALQARILQLPDSVSIGYEQARAAQKFVDPMNLPTFSGLVSDENGQRSAFLLSNANTDEQSAILDTMDSTLTYEVARRALTDVDPSLRTTLIDKVRTDNGERAALAFSDADDLVRAELLAGVPDGSMRSDLAEEIRKDALSSSPDVQEQFFRVLSNDGYQRAVSLAMRDHNDVIREMNIQGEKFYSPTSLVTALALTENDPEAQVECIELYNKGEYPVTALLPSDKLMEAMESTRNNPEAQRRLLQDSTSLSFFDTQAVLANAADTSIVESAYQISNSYPASNPQTMGFIYDSPAFQRVTGGASSEERLSYAVTTERLLAGRELTNENVAEALQDIRERRDAFSERVILGPDTDSFIPITHDETNDLGDYRFQEDKLTDIAIKSGTPPSAIVSGLKGRYAKDQAIESISQSKGDTTIWFLNHGGENHQWLSEGYIGSENSDIPSYVNAISYQEIAAALQQREISGNKISDVNIVIGSCHSYDFAQALYAELGARGVKSLPVVITETNRGQYGYSFSESDPQMSEYGVQSIFVHGVYRELAEGKPLTGKEMLSSFQHSMPSQDAAVFVPKGASVLPIGSSNDAPVPDAVIVPDGGMFQMDEDTATYIEIGQIETPAADRLFYG